MPIIVDFLDMIEEQKRDPCFGCQNGRCDISQYVDEKTGRLMQISEDCSETCDKLKRDHKYLLDKSMREHQHIWKELADG